MDVTRLLLKLPETVSLHGELPDATVQFATSSTPVYYEISSGSVTAHEGTAGAPDFTVRASDSDLVALLRGSLHPMKALMLGRLKIKGNAMLAQSFLNAIDRSEVAKAIEAEGGTERA